MRRRVTEANSYIPESGENGSLSVVITQGNYAKMAKHRQIDGISMGSDPFPHATP
jgi:hypothetical protein